MAWQMPLEKLLFLAYRGLKSQVPETGNWKQWHYISLNAEVLLFSCPVGWKLPYPGNYSSSVACQGVDISTCIAYPGIANGVTNSGSSVAYQAGWQSVAYLGGWQL
jgi:hypothetical protein